MNWPSIFQKMVAALAHRQPGSFKNENAPNLWDLGHVAGWQCSKLALLFEHSQSVSKFLLGDDVEVGSLRG